MRILCGQGSFSTLSTPPSLSAIANYGFCSRYYPNISDSFIVAAFIGPTTPLIYVEHEDAVRAASIFSDEPVASFTRKVMAEDFYLRQPVGSVVF